MARADSAAEGDRLLDAREEAEPEPGRKRLHERPGQGREVGIDGQIDLEAETLERMERFAQTIR
ncbi:MAG TPA: hypothetical protein VGD07_21425 [Methylomirabilota bacterium]